MPGMNAKEAQKIYNSKQWKLLRKAVLIRDKGECQLKYPVCRKVATCVDHTVPLAEGGAPYDPLNCAAACRPCNSAKAARSALPGSPPAKPSTYVPSRDW